MKNFLLGDSWKTSLWGYGMAFLTGAAQAISSGTVEPTAVIFAAGFAVFGRLAKDFNVTGAK